MVLLGRLGLGLVLILIVCITFHRSSFGRWRYSRIYGSIDSAARSIDGCTIDRSWWSDEIWWEQSHGCSTTSLKNDHATNSWRVHITASLITQRDPSLVHNSLFSHRVLTHLHGQY